MQNTFELFNQVILLDMKKVLFVMVFMMAVLAVNAQTTNTSAKKTTPTTTTAPAAKTATTPPAKKATTTEAKTTGKHAVKHKTKSAPPKK